MDASELRLIIVSGLFNLVRMGVSISSAELSKNEMTVLSAVRKTTHAVSEVVFVHCSRCCDELLRGVGLGVPCHGDRSPVGESSERPRVINRKSEPAKSITITRTVTCAVNRLRRLYPRIWISILQRSAHGLHDTRGRRWLAETAFTSPWSVEFSVYYQGGRSIQMRELYE